MIRLLREPDTGAHERSNPNGKKRLCGNARESRGQLNGCVKFRLEPDSRQVLYIHLIFIYPHRNFSPI